MLIVKFWRFSFWTVLLFSNAVFASEWGKLVLVVDDLGNQHQSGLDAINSPWITTVAVMPARPYSTELANYAHSLGKEVIIHAPMSNTINFPLGELGLTRTDGQQQLMQNVVKSIESVPHAVGLSNHMGSQLTQDAEAMSWVMEVLRDHGFYFFDSKTVATTKGWQVAEQFSIPWSKRDVFLDHFRSADFMEKQWRYALAKVQEGENVTVICHPYPETLAFLSQLQDNPEISKILVPLSHVLNYPFVVQRSYRNIPRGS